MQWRWHCGEGWTTRVAWRRHHARGREEHHTSTSRDDHARKTRRRSWRTSCKSPCGEHSCHVRRHSWLSRRCLSSSRMRSRGRGRFYVDGISARWRFMQISSACRGSHCISCSHWGDLLFAAGILRTRGRRRSASGRCTTRTRGRRRSASGRCILHIRGRRRSTSRRCGCSRLQRHQLRQRIQRL